MYRAPLRELRFVLHELLQDSRLGTCPAYSGYDAAFADAVLEEAGKFAEGVLAPINQIGDLEGAKWTPHGVVMPAAFKHAFAKFSENGWCQLRSAAKYGGQDAPLVLGTAVEEMWASANLAFKLCPMLTQGAIEAIDRCGSEEQKRRFVPRLVSGEWTGTMNLTEPQAGSDLGAIRTRAIPQGKHYRLYGQKIFITYGDHDFTSNIIHLVLARIEGAPAGTKGISLFIVPKVLVDEEGLFGERNDVRCISIEHKLGIHASPTCTMSYGDNEGAIGYLVGETNRGLEYMFIMMNAARLSVGLEGYALAETAYQRAVEYARTRVQGRSPGTYLQQSKTVAIIDHPDVKRMLLSMKSQTDAARAITLYAAMQLDLARHHPDASVRAEAQARGDLLIPIIKGWSTEIGVTLASMGVQVHGGLGFVEETGAAQHLRDARICTIYEGTTGIQASDLVGRKVGRDAGTAMNALIQSIRADLDAMSTDPSGRCVGAAGEAVGLLSKATESILEAHKAGVDHVQSIAVPYLMLCGVVIGGWLMARSHVIAERADNEDRDFYAAKRQIARFYMDQILPEAGALARTVMQGAECVVQADAALL